MSYYLVHVAINPKIGVLEREAESEVRLKSFLKATFGDNACVLDDFGVGEMGDFHAMEICVETPNSMDDNGDDERVKTLLRDWLEAQCPNPGMWWFDEESNPLHCPDGEYDRVLNSAVMQHYGTMALR